MKNTDYMYPCLCTYQSDNNALTVDAKYLNLPVVQNQEELLGYIEQIPLQWFKKQSITILVALRCCDY